MSVQLHLTRPDLKFGDLGYRHPDWLDVANGDHKRFAREVLYHLPHEQHQLDDYEWVVRPTDFDLWRDAVQKHNLCNAELFHQMIDLMEVDSRYWLEVSQ